VADAEPIGRDAEHATVLTFLDRAERGPAALVLFGPAGIGKTTIWRHALREARERGFRTLETRAVQAEAQLAFAGLTDLFDRPFDEVAHELPPAQRLALEVALQRQPVEGPPPPPLAVSLGTLSALRALAGTGPVLLGVDDLPWLDGPSARVVEYVARRVTDLPIGFLPTIRVSGGQVALPPAVTEFAGTTERLPVGPLDMNAIDALLRRELRVSLRRPALAWVHRECRGNPFLALELARAVEREGSRPGLELPTLPTEAEALVRTRLEALPETSGQALAAVAALSQPTRRVVTAAVADAGEALDAAVQAGILEEEGGRLRFTHPLLASGAYGLLEAGERRELHARLAAAVGDPEQHARHLALATAAPDEAVAEELDRAAEHARSRGASDTAAELAEQASLLTPPGMEVAIRERVVAAGWHFIHAGDPGRARGILERYVASASAGAGRADALRVLADVRSSDDWEAKISLLSQALEEAGADHRLRSLVLEARSQALSHALHDARSALADALAAVAEADESQDPIAICSACLTATFAQMEIGQEADSSLMTRAMALAAEVERQGVFRWPRFAYALVESMHDRLEAAATILAELHGRAAALGDWDTLPLIATFRAQVTFQRGRWGEALALAQEGEAGSRQNGQQAGLSRSLAVRALVQAGMGADREAIAAVREGLALATRINALALGIGHHQVMGLMALSMGDPLTAEAELREAVRLPLAEGYVGLTPMTALADLAEALAALDRADEALALLDAHADRVRQVGPGSLLAAMERSRGMAAATLGDQLTAAASFDESLGLQAAVGDPFERARTLLAQGGALRRFRQRGQAREALQEAVRLFAALPAPRWRERAEAELSRTGHRDAGAPLSATEQQVADLVAAGRTNREVADALFMSPHTVEAHLTRIYRSLGVRGRTELARALARGGTERGEPPATSA
jgi:DNA-binding CsgD family transcriptional regulator